MMNVFVKLGFAVLTLSTSKVSASVVPVPLEDALQGGLLSREHSEELQHMMDSEFELFDREKIVGTSDSRI